MDLIVSIFFNVLYFYTVMDQMKLIVSVKKIDQKLIMGGDLNAEDLDFLFHCLKEKDDDVVVAALLVITEAELEVLERFMGQFETYSTPVRRMAIPFLACTDFVECYAFLIDRLRFREEVEEGNIIVQSLAYTHYAVFPLVLAHLGDEEVFFVRQLKRVIFQMGISKLAPFIGAMPQIPYEAVFRELFGDEAIEKIKG